MSTAAPSGDPRPTEPTEPAYSRVRLTLGLVGRTWLWFLAGCLVVTLLPVVIGWRPYLIESGSMAPRIQVGDVVIASPEQDPQVLLGRVAVFTDPDRPDRTKTHRVVRIADDGTLVTKGDANPTEDSAHVAVSDVKGIGRLLVRFVGLPLTWLQTGQWWWLLAFLAGIGLAVRWVGRDHEDEEPPTGDGAPPDPAPYADAGERRSGYDIAAMRPTPLERRAGRVRWVRRAAYAALLAAVLVLPTSTAAFSANTRNSGNTWAAANLSYTTEVQDLNPWLYWKLDDTSGNTAADSSGTGGRTGRYRSNGGGSYFTRGITGALGSDSPNLAVTLEDSASCITMNGSAVTPPTALTEVVWFRTTSDQGGKLLGWELPQTGVRPPDQGRYDKHLYLDGSGHVLFGAYNNGFYVIGSTSTYNDGQWHMAAATLGTGGTRLFVDGAQVASSTNTSGESYPEWVRAGCGNLAGWTSGWSGPNQPSGSTATAQNYPFAGSLDEVSVWDRALTANDIALLWYAH